MDRQCTVCGVNYRARRSSSKYCSPLCASRAKEQRRGLRHRMYHHTCIVCGSAFSTSSTHCAACSPGCKRAASLIGRSSSIPWWQCETCGTWGISRWPRTYCSAFCGRAGRGYQALASSIEYKDCQRCGGWFVRREGQTGAFCSERCAKTTRNRNRSHIQRSRTKQGERITLKGLGDRDGWHCHICKRSVTSKPGNLQTSPSIDHLVPLSTGGEHSWLNVALAHRGCNSLRGSAGVAQLRLIS